MTTRRQRQDDPTEAMLGENIQREIDILSTLSIDALRARYRRVTRKPAPPHLRSWLLVRILAYELQVRSLGGLDQASEKFLDKLAERIKRKREETSSLGGIFRPDTKTICALVPSVTQPSGLMPGTVLVREHGGKEHRVTVLVRGFSWNDATFASLSEVAKAITGTSWSGPRFFGLQDKKRPSRENDTVGTKEV